MTTKELFSQHAETINALVADATQNMAEAQEKLNRCTEKRNKVGDYLNGIKPKISTRMQQLKEISKKAKRMAKVKPEDLSDIDTVVKPFMDYKQELLEERKAKQDYEAAAEEENEAFKELDRATEATELVKKLVSFKEKVEAEEA